MKKKSFIYPILFIIFLIILIPNISLTKHIIVENQPFKYPNKISKITFDRITLENGNTIYLGPTFGRSWEETFAISDNTVEIYTDDDGIQQVYGRRMQLGLYCGTGRRVIIIPIFKHTKYMYTIELIAVEDKEDKLKFNKATLLQYIGTEPGRKREHLEFEYDIISKKEISKKADTYIPNRRTSLQGGKVLYKYKGWTLEIIYKEGIESKGLSPEGKYIHAIDETVISHRLYKDTTVK
ncbi:MAG: hypothetical protein COA79_22020 [Planctomycetota bacterium]|nr:MAG: hypothetical protein COA79_22020 [Planctomycetota bacterium]